MKIIVCVDKRYGIMFNNRRVSRDRILVEDICENIENNKLWISNYSLELFKDKNLNNLVVDNEMLNKASKEDYCFIEDIVINNYIDKIDEITLYNWNRDYPADKYFNVNLEEWNLTNEEEIVGSSHEQIIKQVYERRDK